MRQTPLATGSPMGVRNGDIIWIATSTSLGGGLPAGEREVEQADSEQRAGAGTRAQA